MPGESLQGHSAGTVSPPPSPCRPVAECQTRGHGQHPTQGPALCLTARRPWAGLTPQPADAPPVRWEQPSTSPVSAVGSHESTQKTTPSHRVIPYLASDILELIQPDLKSQANSQAVPGGKTPKCARQHSRAAPALKPQSCWLLRSPKGGSKVI